MLKQIDARTPEIIIGQFDTAQRLDLTLTDECGNAVDISQANVAIRRRHIETNALQTWVLDEIPPGVGRVIFFWPYGSNDVPGDYQLQVVASWEGQQETFPKGNYGHILMRITALV